MTPDRLRQITDEGESLSIELKLITEENQAGRILGLDDLLLLNALWQERYLATTEAARLIQKSEVEARAVLEHLVETGLIESRGERKGRMYHLSASTYKRLGEKAAYIRQPTALCITILSKR